MPESFFILSKENLELARDEIIAISRTYDRFAKYQYFENLVIIQSKTEWKTVTDRATFVKFGGHVLRKLSNLFLDEKSSSSLLYAKTFACRVINLSSKKSDFVELEKSMGAMITKFTNAKVCLENPEVIVYLILSSWRSFFGLSTQLKIQGRPKKITKHPHELDWKLSRVMINLAGLKDDETVCDPFCGTGTTLLEAGSMGIRSIGIDFDKKMYKASKDNIAKNGYDSSVIHAEYSYIDKIKNKYHGIVTDIPYGNASKKKNKHRLL